MKTGSKITGRTQAIVKNGFYAVIFTIISYSLSFFTRKVFILTLGSIYLGYEGLFSNIFAILGTAEAGMVSLLYYALYKAVANNDENEISNLMTVHKYYYFLVGMFIMIMGILISFLLPNLITGNSLNWRFVYKIYYMQLVSTGLTYFLVYRRTLFAVAQLGYICIKVDGLCTIIATFIKIIILYLTKSFYAYLLVGLIYNIISNLIIIVLYKKRFPTIKKTRITWQYIKDHGFIKDLYNMFIGTLAGKVYASTDSLVISKCLNINMAGLYSNYFMINIAVDALINRAIDGISPATGNFVHTESRERIVILYKMMNILFYFLSVFIASSFITLFQPFIKWWLGDMFLLPYSYVIGISVNEYISWNHYFMAVLRGTQAHFEIDKWAYTLSAITNITLSILLSKSMGITGVVIGTIAGSLFFWIGRAYVVHKYIVDHLAFRYFCTEVLKAIFAVIQSSGIVLITKNFPHGLAGIFMRFVALILYYLVINFILCHILPDGKLVKVYLRDIYHKNFFRKIKSCS